MKSLCDACYLQGFCARAKATVPNVATVRKPEVRLAYQNYLVALKMSYHALIDFQVHAIRDFLGRYVDETGEFASVPGIACILNPGAEFWYRDLLEAGAWKSVADVPRLRREAIPRWRLLGTVINIVETVQPVCPPR